MNEQLDKELSEALEEFRKFNVCFSHAADPKDRERMKEAQRRIVEIARRHASGVNLPSFADGLREYFLGRVSGVLQSDYVDFVRSDAPEWLAQMVMRAQGQPYPAIPQVRIKKEELAAFHRFCDCADDGEGYDVPKEMMKQLSVIGLVRSAGFGRYETTLYGTAIRESTQDPAK